MYLMAFAWGLAEATLFFIVPDVGLTILGWRDLRRAMRVTVAALLGALTGGAIMFGFGSRDVLLRVPGVHEPLVAAVNTDISRHGIAALLVGPLKGVPYKI